MLGMPLVSGMRMMSLATLAKVVPSGAVMVALPAAIIAANHFPSGLTSMVIVSRKTSSLKPSARLSPCEVQKAPHGVEPLKVLGSCRLLRSTIYAECCGGLDRRWLQ